MTHTLTQTQGFKHSSPPSRHKGNALYTHLKKKNNLSIMDVELVQVYALGCYSCKGEAKVVT